MINDVDFKIIAASYKKYKLMNAQNRIKLAKTIIKYLLVTNLERT